MAAAPILIMAGGTGGHVFPGLAVAEALRARDRSVVWLGTHRGLESRLVPAAGIEIEWISIAGVRGRGPGAWLWAPFRIAWAILQAIGVMIRRRPAAVLGLGGFVAGPGGIAAWLTRRPLLIHEQNAVAGTTNRWLARFARRIYEAFPGSFPPGVEAIEIGNPVRRSIVEGARPVSAADQRPVRVLVIGGSQGALVLNRTVPEAVALLPETLRPEIRHQAGRSLEAAEQAYRQAGLAADCREFIDDMAEAYAWADLVIARAGALTLSELAVCGRGAILVPYPFAIDDHQQRNAERFERAGAAIVVRERDLNAGQLAEVLGHLLRHRAEIVGMGRQCQSLMRPDAADRLADACLELAGVPS